MMDYAGELPAGIVQVGEGQYAIQGKPAGSSWEVNYAIALSNAKWEYEYLAAWWIWGKPLEIDFRVFTVPKVTFIFIDGGRWHSGQEGNNDLWERQSLYVLTKNSANFPITVNNPDTDTYDHAWAHVIRTLGRR